MTWKTQTENELFKIKIMKRLEKMFKRMGIDIFKECEIKN